MKNIAIIGAGITGITTAYQLLERGYNVSVFDKNRYAAMETSFANGGQLSACNAEVWNSWSTIGKGIQWMLKKDAPLLFNPKLNFHKISWIIDFINNIPNHKKNTILTAKMAIHSRDEFKRILEAELRVRDVSASISWKNYGTTIEQIVARITSAILERKCAEEKADVFLL